MSTFSPSRKDAGEYAETLFPTSTTNVEYSFSFLKSLTMKGIFQASDGEVPPFPFQITARPSKFPARMICALRE